MNTSTSIITFFLFLTIGLLPTDTHTQNLLISDEQATALGGLDKMNERSIVFATHASDQDELSWALLAIESIREFAGELKDAPIWLYLIDSRPELERAALIKKNSLNYAIKTCSTPNNTKPFIFSGKVAAAAIAETEANGKYDLLAWLDPDMIFVNEPSSFLLSENVCFGYRPVMHKLIGSDYEKPPDEFWRILYQKLAIPDSAIFPVVTPVDEQIIRGYFNAGIMIVRPNCQILRKWAKEFTMLCNDSSVVNMVNLDDLRKIFFHQTVLACAIMGTLNKGQTTELPPTYNYPLNLANKYPPTKKPASLDNLVMFRHDMKFKTPEQLSGTADSSKIINWMIKKWPALK
jgi:hypothetical protein